MFQLTCDDVVLVAYSEIALKSAPVRRQMTNQLTTHIKNMLDREGLVEAEVDRIQGRLIVRKTDAERAALIASKVFGVASTMSATETSVDLDAIVQTATKLAIQTIKPNQTFAVDARRIGEHPYTSKDVEARVGEEVLRRLSDRKVRVNLEKPDETIYVEARPRAAYVYNKILRGPGGLPFGSQGKLIGLFSGGIDSPVASWLMMKRGAFVKLLFLDQRPFVGDDYRNRAVKVAQKLRENVPLKDYYLYTAPIGEIMKWIVENVPSRLICVICKRMMYRIACRLAEREGADGIVTGENLGQVASQTLANLRVLDEAVALPVYRPLIGLEKLDSIRMARKIGTYDLSAVSTHGCEAVPSKPTTRAKIDDVKRAEEKLKVEELVSEALKGISRILL